MFSSMKKTISPIVAFLNCPLLMGLRAHGLLLPLHVSWLYSLFSQSQIYTFLTHRTLYFLLFIYFVNPQNQVYADHVFLVYVRSTKNHIFKENWLSLSKWLSVANNSSAGGGTLWLFPLIIMGTCIVLANAVITSVISYMHCTVLSRKQFLVIYCLWLLQS